MVFIRPFKIVQPGYFDKEDPECIQELRNQLEKVSDGIFVAIVNDGGGAVGNAGFVDLGGETLFLIRLTLNKRLKI